MRIRPPSAVNGAFRPCGRQVGEIPGVRSGTTSAGLTVAVDFDVRPATRRSPPTHRRRAGHRRLRGPLNLPPACGLVIHGSTPGQSRLLLSQQGCPAVVTDLHRPHRQHRQDDLVGPDACQRLIDRVVDDLPQCISRAGQSKARCTCPDAYGRHRSPQKGPSVVCIGGYAAVFVGTCIHH